MKQKISNKLSGDELYANVMSGITVKLLELKGRDMDDSEAVDVGSSLAELSTIVDSSINCWLES